MSQTKISDAEYQRRKILAAEDYITFKTCKDCGSPHVAHIRCIFCGSSQA